MNRFTHLAFGMAFLLIVLLGGTVRAATVTWNLGTGGNWNVAGNWSPAAVPVAGDDVVFPGTFTTGTITLTAGQSCNSISSSATGTVTISGAFTLTLGTGGITQTGTGSLSIGSNIALTAATNTISAAAVNGIFISGVISGAGTNLTVSGAGETTLVGANTFTGSIAVASKLNVNGDGALGAVANGITLNPSGFVNATATFTLTAGRTITLSGGGFGANGGSTLTYGGNISGGAAGLNINGLGTLSLSGNNTYTGPTTISGNSTLLLGSTTALPSATPVSVGATCTLDLNSFNVSIGSLAGTGQVNLTGTATLTTGGDSTNTAFSGIIGGPGNLTKVGTGNFTLSGNNTYNGVTNINAGKIIVTTANALGTTAGGTVVANLAALVYNGGITFNTAEPITINGNGPAGNGAIEGNTATNNVINAVITLGSNATIATSPTMSSILQFNGGVNLGTNTLTTGGTGQVVFGSVISGGGGITASGTMCGMGAMNTYGGPTNVTSGTMSLGVNNALPSGTALTLSPGGSLDMGNAICQVGQLLGGGTVMTGGTGGTLTVNVTTPHSFTGMINGTNNSLSVIGNNILTLSGANGYTGTTNIGGTATLTISVSGVLPAATALTCNGTLNLNNNNQTVGSITGTGSVTTGLGAGGTLTVGDASSTTFSGIISGNGGLAKNGTGTLTLANASTFANATAVNNGVLACNFTNALPIGTALFVTSPGVYTTGINPQTVGALNGTGNITIGAGGLTAGNATNPAYSGVMSGTGSFTKAGTGTLTLNGANTYSGATTISLGTLKAGASSALPSITALSITAGATWDLNSFNATVGSLAGGGNVTLGTATATVGDATSTTFSGVISGTGSLTKIGAGTLTLSGPSTYAGTTTVNGGTLQLGASNALPIVTMLTVNVTCTFNSGTFNQQVAGLSGSGSVTTGVGSLLTVNTTLPNTFSGIISGSGALTMQGAGGVLTLSGTNTFTGPITINSGSLKQGIANAFSTASGITIVSPGILDLGGFNASLPLITGSGGISGGPASLTVTAASPGTFSGVIGTAINLTKAGASVWTLSGANTYTGTTLVSAGTLQIGAANALPSLTALSISGGATFDMQAFACTVSSFAGAGNITTNAILTTGGDNTSTTLSGTITGTGGLTKNGTGNLTLTPTGGNTYTGTTQINNGTITANANTAVGAAASSVTVAAGATLASNGFSIPENLFLNGTGYLNAGALAVNAGVGGIASGTINLQSAGANFVCAPGTTFTISGIIQDGGGNFDLIKDGPGTLVLGNSGNTYGGNASVFNGTLQLGVANGLNTSRPLHLGNATNSGTFDLAGFNQLVTDLATVGSGTLNTVTDSGAAATFEVDNTGISTYGGLMTGVNLTFIKGNTGQLTLTNTNSSYGGFTKVYDGTLIVSANVPVSVNSPLGNAASQVLVGDIGGTLNAAFLGSGGVTIGRDILINSGSTGTASIGSSAGAATFTGAVSLTKGVTLSAAVGGAATFNGVISGAFNVTSAGPGTVTLAQTNTYSGNTNITAGYLVVSANGAMGSGTGTTSVQTGAVLQLQGGVNYSLAQTTSINGVGTGNGAILSNTGANIYAGPITLMGSSGVGVATGSLTLNGVISGPFSLTTFGGGTLSLGAASTYTGSTNIQNGTVTCGINNALPPATTLILGSGPTGGTLELNGCNQTVGLLTTSGTGVNKVNNASATPSTFVANLASPCNFTGGIAGNLALVKDGVGILTLSGGVTDTWSGPTSIINGTLKLGAANSLPITNLQVGAAANSGTLDINGFNTTLTDLFVSGTGITNTVTNGGTAATLTINSAIGGTYSGIISGANLSLIKSGAGVFTLSGNSTYSGTTNINSGVLVVGGSITSPVSVANTAILGGTGSVNAITALSGSTVSPGPAVGTLTGQSADFTSGGTLQVRVPSQASNDLLTVSGGITLGPSAKILIDMTSYTGAMPRVAASVAHGNTSVTGTFGVVNVVNNISGKSVAMQYSANDAKVVVDALPVVLLNSPSAGFNAMFTQNAGPVLAASSTNATITDSDDTSLNSITATIVNNLDGPNETLAATPSGIIVAGDIVYNSVTGTLTVSHPGATVADFQAVLRSVKYNNVAPLPNAIPRTINFAANDGLLIGAPATTIMSITAKPIINSPPAANAVAGAAFNYMITAINSPTAFNATNLPAGLSVNMVTGAITGSVAVAGSYNVMMSASNTAGITTVPLTITITAGAFNKLLVLLPGETPAPGTPTGKANAAGNQAAGIAFTAGVQAVDASFNPVIAVTDTISITSNDAAALLPANAAMVNGAATFQVTLNSIGPRTVTASDVTNAALTGNTSSLTVTKGTTNIGFTSAPNPSITGQPVVFKATLPPSATGNVTFNEGAVVLGTVALAAGKGTLTLSTLTTGAHTLTATYAGDTNFSGSSGTLTQTVNNAIPVITSPLTASVAVGTAFKYQIAATNNPTKFDAQSLPAGLSVDPNTGIISGTPSATGPFSVTIIAGNAGTPGSAILTLTVIGAPAFISQPSFSSQVGTPFLFIIAAATTPEQGSVTFTSSTLPPGLILSGSQITGTPTMPGSYTITLTATNSAGVSSTQTLSIAISAPPPIITSSLTVAGQVGLGFSYAVSAAGFGPFTFATANLPTGLLFNGSSISGTPTTAGNASVNLQATDGIGQTVTATLSITIMPKGKTSPPGLLPIAATLPAIVGESVFFSTASTSATKVNILWDFGDGSSGSGEPTSHIYSAPGSVAVTASDSSKVTVQTLKFDVVKVDPAAPRIIDIVSSANPALVNTNVNYGVTAVDPNSTALTVLWNFGDGTPSVSGVPGTIISHTYATDGSFTVSVVATNAGGLSSLPFNRTQFVLKAPGEKNINDGTKIDNPLNGLTITEESSGDGIIQLSIDVDALLREAFEVSTDFGRGGALVMGTKPAAKFDTPGIFVASTHARDLATKVLKGKARKTIPISRREVGLPAIVKAEPKSTTLKVKSLKGSFSFNRTTDGALKSPNAKPDQVTMSGQFELPVGLDLSQPQEVQIAVGNVVEELVMDAKGHAKGSVADFKLKTKTRGMTGENQMGSYTLKLRAVDMTSRGFDTEGVGAKPRKTDLKIQCAVLMGGVSYELDMPVKLSVSKKGDSGAIFGRSN